MGDILRNDLSSLVLGEFSPLSSRDNLRNIRLNPKEQLDAFLHQARAPFVVAKPLVESQKALQLLNQFQDLKILWMFRDYRDVTQSNLAKFGERNGINDLRPIIKREAGNWRAEKIPEQVHAELKELFSEDMDAHDAAALFWYSRNQLFFSQRLEKHPRVYLCSYQELVERPSDIVPDIYSFIGRRFPGPAIYSDIHKSSVGKGRSVKLSGQVDSLCQDLLDRLTLVSRKQVVSVV